MPMTSPKPPSSARDRGHDVVDPVEVVLADVHDGQHRLVREQEVGTQQLALLGVERRCGRSARPRPARRARRRARRPRRRSTCPAWPPCAASRLALDGLEVGQAQLDLERRAGGRADRSDRARRRRRTPAARTRWRRPRGCRRGTGCPGPRPWLAPSTRPPMSTNCTLAGTTFCECSSPRAGRGARRAPSPRRRSGPWWRTRTARRARCRRRGRCTAMTCRRWAGRRTRSVPPRQANGRQRATGVPGTGCA